ncbi:Radical SAM superfamily enzyme, MoaA/NifB/PqqE/SkfB family [Thermomonospora echinospora]|uniref:Radical SAM superfamily enzyme, MoaA/NifB/PqqE/SkfB family n=1 Tax=Thermomonospora echinospora TaxID=1992 RepID=A0A1H6E245_9ACTN|nr:radical SAM protein [Thermomonospora echinospora]SEG91748.1 Radical SAM superfamily enzyme, MoaA/NifB/PqqE/SkfB family [Thermomonospora echinospora]
MLLPTVQFDDEAQCFTSTDNVKTEQLVAAMDRPLSLTFQLTRNCNFRCVYCSEPPGIRTRAPDEVLAMIDKLAGMRRIIFSGGEPMAYKHFWRVLEHAQGKFERIVLSTNASLITRDAAARLRDLVHYVDVTVDGPRRQHNAIRGQYDKVIRGLRRLAEEEIPLSVICVYMGRNKHVINYIAQTGDIFGAKKVKILTTIPKGLSKNLFEDFTTGEELDRLYEHLQAERERNGWKPRITIADWMRIGAGHAILIEPDGRAVASPVWQEPDCIVPFGNLHTQTVQQLWDAFPYKTHHLDKYLERTMIVLE